MISSQVVEQRHAESQALLQDMSRAPSEQGNNVLKVEPSMRPATAQQDSRPFSLNLSFEELSGVGLEEPPRHSSGYSFSNNPNWPVSPLSLRKSAQNVKDMSCVHMCARVHTSYPPNCDHATVSSLSDVVLVTRVVACGFY